MFISNLLGSHFTVIYKANVHRILGLVFLAWWMKVVWIFLWCPTSLMVLIKNCSFLFRKQGVTLHKTAPCTKGCLFTTTDLLGPGAVPRCWGPVGTKCISVPDVVAVKLLKQRNRAGKNLRTVSWVLVTFSLLYVHPYPALRSGALLPEDLTFSSQGWGFK